MQRDNLPGQWEVWAPYIYTRNGREECANYRPICITRIYIIWHRLQTNRIARILHLTTSSTQYGYRSGRATIDAIIRIEHAIQTGHGELSLLLIDISKTFACVNRTLLWATHYKQGIPIKTIQYIRNGPKNTTLRCKDNDHYGPSTPNAIGFPQVSAISALFL